MNESGFHQDPEIENVLAEQLANVGARVPYGGTGASTGWTARRLKTETAHQIVDILPDRMDDVISALGAILEPAARKSDSQTVQVTRFRGIVGSGFGGMNPAYVLAIADPEHGTISVAAHAKEGLIKQRTAKKAIQSVLEALSL